MTASKKERKPISTGSEWTFDLIRAYDREISRIAERDIDPYSAARELIESIGA